MRAHIDPDRETDMEQACPEETLAPQAQTHRFHDTVIYNKVSLTETEGKPKSF